MPICWRCSRTWRFRKIDAAVEKVWIGCWGKWSRKPKAEHAEEWCATISTRLRFMIRHIGNASSKTPTKRKAPEWLNKLRKLAENCRRADAIEDEKEKECRRADAGEGEGKEANECRRADTSEDEEKEEKKDEEEGQGEEEEDQEESGEEKETASEVKESETEKGATEGGRADAGEASEASGQLATVPFEAAPTNFGSEFKIRANEAWTGRTGPLWEGS